MLLGVAQTEIAQLLEINLSLVEDVHLQGNQVSEVHLVVHDAYDTVYNR